MKNEFALSDKTISTLNRMLVRTFSNLKSSLNFDELNVLADVKKQYERINSEVKRQYRRLARQQYADTWAYLLAAGLAKADMPSARQINSSADAAMKETLGGYNHVTGYVFEHEIERKSARMAEAVIAAQTIGDRDKAFKVSLKLLSNQIFEYSDMITLEVTKAAYVDAGIKRVIWRTRHDEKRCKTCKNMDGNVYNLSSAPDKPHYNCRCWLEPYV